MCVSVSLSLALCKYVCEVGRRVGGGGGEDDDDDEEEEEEERMSLLVHLKNS